ncbi:MAG: biopolymer transporter ExbD [Rhodospirillales bacterium]|nr:biopolymer transporter ExbD [Rhodospirillales bacterium]
MLQRRRKRAKADLDMTPLMDVVFLLLLFFMLTSTFIERKSIELLLPESATAAGEADQALLRVQLLPTGDLAIADQTLPQGRIAARVGRELSEHGQDELILEADLRCSVQQMVDAMDTLKRAGASQVHLVTERRE